MTGWASDPSLGRRQQVEKAVESMDAPWRGRFIVGFPRVSALMGDSARMVKKGYRGDRYLMHGMAVHGRRSSANIEAMARQQKDQGIPGLAVQEATPKLKRPRMYKVLLVNDDYTPMDFVVHVLEFFFRMGREQATQVMLHVHTRGMGVCGVFTREIAETKVALVNDFSQKNQHPLLCTMEEA